MIELILQGKTTEHLVPLPGTKFLVHEKMLQDFLKLQKAAEAEGFDLQLASAFRDYDRQAMIWNKKASGEKVLLDSDERPLEFSKLSSEEVMWAILRWSAIPGCSRHHWGTDVDVFDGVTQKREDVQLITSECENEGPAAELHLWLDDRIESNNSFGFYRCYRMDRGGVAPERWHLSYGPVSLKLEEKFTYALFKKNLQDSSLLLKKELLDNAEEIYQRFIINTDRP